MSERGGLPGHGGIRRDLILVWILARSSGATAGRRFQFVPKILGVLGSRYVDIFLVVNTVRSKRGWVMGGVRLASVGWVSYRSCVVTVMATPMYIYTLISLFFN
jgi:hypothetical protein